MADHYRMGDHWVQDDTTGQKVRASKTAQQWDGAIVATKNFDPRQPLDLLRSIPDNPAVRDPRPQAIDTFIGPLDTQTTVDAAAGAQLLTLKTSVRMLPADRISIALDTGDMFLTTISGIVDLTRITITGKLPSKVTAGAMVYDNSAVSEPILP